MITATYKKKPDHIRCVHVYRDSKEIAHREFKSGKVAKAYAMLYDENYKRVN